MIRVQSKNCSKSLPQLFEIPEVPGEFVQENMREYMFRIIIITFLDDKLRNISYEGHFVGGTAVAALVLTSIMLVLLVVVIVLAVFYNDHLV